MAPKPPYPAELRKRAVRMVIEVRSDHPAEWAAINVVAAKLGIGTAGTLRTWIRQAQIDEGVRSGTTSDESAEPKKLRRENAEPRRANDILKAASFSSGGRCSTPIRGNAMDSEIREDRSPQGREKLHAERQAYSDPVTQGPSTSEARRTAGINRRTGHRWRYGRASQARADRRASR